MTQPAVDKPASPAGFFDPTSFGISWLGGLTKPKRIGYTVGILQIQEMAR